MPDAVVLVGMYFYFLYIYEKDCKKWPNNEIFLNVYHVVWSKVNILKKKHFPAKNWHIVVNIWAYKI